MVVLPTPKECFHYIKAGKRQLYFFGSMSFILLLTGMVMFTIAHPIAIVYVGFVLLTTSYLTVSYIVGIFGKEFSLREHNELVAPFDLFFMSDKYKPSIDIYYPTCGEPEAMQVNSLNHIIDLARDYGPLCKVYVLDDSPNYTGYNAYNKVKHRLGRSNIFCIMREDRGYLKKAGNLRNAFKQTTGEFIAIFDADFCPTPNFFQQTLPYMLQDQTVGIVQTPQYFEVNKTKNWIENGAAYVQELFYRLIQVNRNSFGGSICVGTNALYRRKCLEPFGGTAEIAYSEDVRTGFQVLSLGYKIKYIPIILAKGLCPNELPQFFLQQYRWAMGSISLFFSKQFWQTKITKMQRVCYLGGMLYYITTGLSLLFMNLPSVFMLMFAPSKILWFNFLFSFPSFVFGTFYQAYWSKHKWGLYAVKSRVVSYHSHLFALVEYLTDNLTPWEPTAITKKTKVYVNFQQFLFWNTVFFSFITIFLSGYNMATNNPFNFLPTLALCLFNTYISLSILRDQI